MIYVPNPNHDPALNLAREEFLLTRSGIRDEILFFYVNDPAIIIGRHQNTAEEIDDEYVKANGIRVVRRCSGGGAVYHDRGNLNFSLITPGDPQASSDFSRCLNPILAALRGLGLQAELTGRNDLTLDGAKFSGNAYYHTRAGSVIHGTLLYDTDLDVLTKALRPRPEKLQTKGIKSVRSRVTNIKDALPNISGVEELEGAIVRHFFPNGPVTHTFTDAELREIDAIADGRYRSDLWNWGESPAFNIRRSFRADCGWIDFRADVREGTLRRARFFGDFFTAGDASELESALTDIPWTERSLREALSDWQSVFPAFELDAFLTALFTEDPHSLTKPQSGYYRL